MRPGHGGRSGQPVPHGSRQKRECRDARGAPQLKSRHRCLTRLAITNLLLCPAAVKGSCFQPETVHLAGGWLSALGSQSEATIEERGVADDSTAPARSLEDNLAGVYGRTVNVAARVAEYARPGEVLVTEEVRSALDAPTRFEPIGPASVKGIGAPLSLYRAIAG
jgi:Adenylate and Guanylate cyclase catalytic domain